MRELFNKALSVYHSNVFITGRDLAVGQCVIALREYGLRANGGSSARKALAMGYGKEWWNNPDARENIQAAATPSALYENFLSDVNGWNSPLNGVPVPRLRMHAIAHITGGGIPSKFFRDILKPRDLSAALDNLWDPPHIMRKFAEWRGVSGKEPYDIWHGGQGALVVVGLGDVEPFCRIADEWGIEVRVAGRVTKSSGSPTLRIKSTFDREWYTWD